MIANGTEGCQVIMNGELAGCDFKWEFHLKRADPFRFYKMVTEPTVGCLSLLIQNQSRLIQLLEAKDQEIQDYTLNGAVLSRKSLQTTIFSSKKGALVIPPTPPGIDLLAVLRSPAYADALEVFDKNKHETNVFLSPDRPTATESNSGNRVTSGNANAASSNAVIRKRGHTASSAIASAVKGPKPMQANKQQSQVENHDKSQEQCSTTPQPESSSKTPEKASSPAKRTRASKNAKTLLKKL